MKSLIDNTLKVILEAKSYQNEMNIQILKAQKECDKRNAFYNKNHFNIGFYFKNKNNTLYKIINYNKNFGMYECLNVEHGTQTKYYKHNEILKFI